MIIPSLQVLAAPVKVRGFCSHAVWRNPRSVLRSNILLYRIRLSNSKLNKTSLIETNADGTFYILSDSDDDFMHESTTVEVCAMLSYLNVESKGATELAG